MPTFRDTATFEIVTLADRPDQLENCAAWQYAGFGAKSSKRNFATARERYEERIHNKDQMPLTAIIMNTALGVPVAMASLVSDDSAHWTQYDAWIGSVYVQENYRGLGLARQIVTYLEDKARAMGVTDLYLTSSTADGLYQKMGYHAHDSRATKETRTGKETLFKKEL